MISRGENTSQPSWTGIPDFAWKLLNDCWDADPGQRPSIHVVRDTLAEASREWERCGDPWPSSPMSVASSPGWSGMYPITRVGNDTDIVISLLKRCLWFFPLEIVRTEKTILHVWSYTPGLYGPLAETTTLVRSWVICAGTGNMLTTSN